MRKHAVRLGVAGLKIAVTLALLAYVMRGADWARLAQSFARITWLTAVIALVLITGQNLLAALRWRFIVARLGSAVPMRSTLHVFYVSLFLGQALPSGIGGDAARVLLLHRHAVPLSRSFNSIVLDRVLTAIGLVLLIALGLPRMLEMGVGGDSVVGIGAVSALVLGGALAIPLIPLLAGLPWVGRLARSFLESRAYLASLWNVLAPIALSCAGFLLMSLLAWVLGRSIDSTLTLVEALVLCPPVFLIATLPISIAGWGVRETAMVVALAYAGVESSVALAISVALGVTVLVGSLPGAAMLATFRHERPVKSEIE